MLSYDSLDSYQSPQTNFQMLTNALADFSPTNLDSDIVSNFVNTNSLVGSGQTVAAFQDRRGPRVRDAPQPRRFLARVALARTTPATPA